MCDATIRDATPEDAEGIARVHVDTWRATYRGLVPDVRLDGMAYGSVAERWRARTAEREAAGWFYIVAEAESGVVGFATGGPERTGHPDYIGEIGGLYILPDWQRKGTGRRLVAASVRRLLDAGLPSLLIWVLRDNPSRGFYERLGGALVGEQPIDIGGAVLVEVAYGWRDARALLQSHPPCTPY
jgi:GNAT superfamily N-acetyltransferase